MNNYKVFHSLDGMEAYDKYSFDESKEELTTIIGMYPDFIRIGNQIFIEEIGCYTIENIVISLLGVQVWVNDKE